MGSCWGTALRRRELLERYYLRHLVEPLDLEELLVGILRHRKATAATVSRLHAIVGDFIHGQ